MPFQGSAFTLGKKPCYYFLLLLWTRVRICHLLQTRKALDTEQNKFCIIQWMRGIVFYMEWLTYIHWYLYIIAYQYVQLLCDTYYV